MDETRVSTAAEMLITDMAHGCTIHRSKGGAPCSVIPPHGYSPTTKGQVSDATIEETIDAWPYIDAIRPERRRYCLR